MTIRNVAIIGANGRLGPAVFEALLGSQIFNVSVLSRSSSTSTYPSNVHLIKIPDDGGDEATLARALEGQNALLVTMSSSDPAYIGRLANAAAQAGIQRFIPPDFGSVDSMDEKSLELVPLYRKKGIVREQLRDIAHRNAHFS